MAIGWLEAQRSWPASHGVGMQGRVIHILTRIARHGTRDRNEKRKSELEGGWGLQVCFEFMIRPVGSPPSSHHPSSLSTNDSTAIGVTTSPPPPHKAVALATGINSIRLNSALCSVAFQLDSVASLFWGARPPNPQLQPSPPPLFATTHSIACIICI